MLAHCRRDHRGLVSAALREVCNAEDRSHARERVGHVLARSEPVGPKVCRLLEEAEEDLIAFYAFPSEHWTKLRTTSPLERVNKEIGRHSDVVGIFPNDASVIRPPASCSLNKTTSGSSNAATSRPSRWL